MGEEAAGKRPIEGYLSPKSPHAHSVTMRPVGLLSGCFYVYETQANNTQIGVIWGLYGFHAGDTKLEAYPGLTLFHSRGSFLE